MLPITISVCQLFSFFQMCSVYVLYLKTEVNILPVQMLSDGETNTICLHKKTDITQINLNCKNIYFPFLT